MIFGSGMNVLFLPITILPNCNLISKCRTGGTVQSHRCENDQILKTIAETTEIKNDHPGRMKLTLPKGYFDFRSSLNAPLFSPCIVNLTVLKPHLFVLKSVRHVNCSDAFNMCNIKNVSRLFITPPDFSISSKVCRLHSLRWTCPLMFRYW